VAELNGRRPRRARAAGSSSPHLARLVEARERIDAEQAERRRREDTALATYAGLLDEVGAITTRRDAALAELEDRCRGVNDEAAAALDAVRARQGQVLAELAALGRRAEDLAALLDVPIKRVRSILRTQPRPNARRKGSQPGEHAVSPTHVAPDGGGKPDASFDAAAPEPEGGT
jgi:DNA-directed RNA polymerase specialized sigma24 family protein